MQAKRSLVCTCSGEGNHTSHFFFDFESVTCPLKSLNPQHGGNDGRAPVGPHTALRPNPRSTGGGDPLGPMRGEARRAPLACMAPEVVAAATFSCRRLPGHGRVGSGANARRAATLKEKTRERLAQSLD